MKTKHIASLAVALILLGGSVSAADKVAVIVNVKNSQTLTETDVKNIYNDNVVNWSSGARISAFDLPAKSEAREQFSQKILGTSTRDAATELANKKITNTAKNPPMTKPESVVISNVAKDPDAIGYVAASAAAGKEGIRVLLIIE